MFPSDAQGLSPRWRAAQSAERNGVLHLSEQAKAIGKAFNAMIRNLFTTYVKPEMKVLEVGCGAYGIISELNCKTKIGIDPLMETYGKYFDLDKRTLYIAAVGEALPIRDNSIDVCFCNNVLDHTSEPSIVLNQINRALKTRGILILGLYCYETSLLWWLALLKEKLPFLRDIYHPHHFTISQLNALLTLTGFKIISHIDITKETYALHAPLYREASVKRALKCLLGKVYYFLFVCQKE